MEIKSWVIATVLFSGAFALLVLMSSDAVTESGATGILNPELEARYNRLAESAALVGSLSETIKQPGGLSLVGEVRSLFQATIGVVNAVFNSLVLIPVVTTNFASDFGIPSIVTTLFFTIGTIIITVAIVFAILNAGSGGRV